MERKPFDLPANVVIVTMEALAAITKLTEEYNNKQLTEDYYWAACMMWAPGIKRFHSNELRLAGEKTITHTCKSGNRFTALIPDNLDSGEWKVQAGWVDKPTEEDQSEADGVITAALEKESGRRATALGHTEPVELGTWKGKAN